MPTPTSHGIVNGHWEPSERHSRLVELMRTGIAKLKKAKRQAEHSNDAEHGRDKPQRPIAAE